MDITVLFKLSYGLYVVGCMDGERPVGCTINTCFQVTSENPIFAISLNKNNYTLEAIKRNPRFSLSILAEDSDPGVIGQFGFCSSRNVDKYADYGYDVVDGAPIVKGRFAGRLILDALNFVDGETHMVVLARLVETVKGEGTPMTYDYYHRVVKGKAPKTAPTFVAERDEAKEEPKCAKRRYRCNLCGYVAEFDGEMPADYHCPICKVDSTQFTSIS
ncbi:MAG: flavin reductase [Bacteroidales bacterium]|nr:flavin reductase [Bacteroidales bacterium]